jgi:hypothetical protein
VKVLHEPEAKRGEPDQDEDPSRIEPAGGAGAARGFAQRIRMTINAIARFAYDLLRDLF